MESKERLRPAVERKQKVLIRSTEEEVKIPKEVAGWLEKVEKKEIYLSSPVTDDQGQVLVTSATAKKPKISLPLSKSGLVVGLKKGVGEAVRWLAEWCLRLIKIYPDRVVLKSSQKGRQG